MLDYQEEKQIEEEQAPAPAHSMAVIAEVQGSAATLLFAGEETPTEKYYPTNKSIVFAPGDRVYVAKVSGTYMVICKSGGADVEPERLDLSAYALKTDLNSYAKVTDLNSYALKTDLSSYALKTDLNSYAKKTEISNFVESTEVNRLYRTASTVYYIEYSGSSVTPNYTGVSLGSVMDPFDGIYIGYGNYYWKIDRYGIIPSYNLSSYFNIGSSSYPIQKLYAKEIYLNGTKLTV